ncbi:MAG: caspase family protein, partial [Planctomycetales bacterium]|nr:caspase family protein [Planctomycetales bacterium]
MTRAKKQVAAIAAVTFLLFAAIANAQDRTALIIANAIYGDGHESEAVKADASQLAESLRSAGFVVAVRENLGAKQFAPAVREFAKQTRTGGVAVIYYMGLAGQYQTYNSKGAWWNYLQGVDVTSGRMDSFPLADLLKALDDHSTADSHFVFLDACGKNPFHGENQRAGLAEVAADDLTSTNTLICLAAQPGKTVEAGRSKLAAALAAQLKQADQPVEQLLAAAKRDVERQSGGEQSPWFVAADEQVAKTAWRDGRRFVASDAPTDGLQAGDEWINGLGMVFCWCPPGKFTMGVAGQASRLSAADITQDERQTGRLFHDAAPTEVTLSRGFWIGKFEMTQREYFRLRNRGPDRESLLFHRNAPLSHLKFGDAENICKLLN